MSPETVPVPDLVKRALESLDAAAASMSTGDVNAAIDDLLAARLLLSGLITQLSDRGPTTT